MPDRKSKAHNQAAGDRHLRIQGIPQDAVLEDQGRMTKIRELVKTLRTEYRTESVIADMSKTGELNRFSEDSKKDFKNWKRSNCLNWEKFPRTYSAHHAPSAGQKDLYCTCGTCLTPSSEQKRKIKSQFENGPTQWQKDIGKRKIQSETR